MRFTSLLSSVVLLGSASVWSSPVLLEERKASAAAQAFYVDGAHIPGISNQTGDLGPSYAGLLPISSKPQDNRKL